MKFKILEGLPADVETDVTAYLNDGWELHGDLFPRKTAEGVIVVVQGISYTPKPNTSPPPKYKYKFNIAVRGNLLPMTAGGGNIVISCGSIQSGPIHGYSAMVTANSQEEAEADVYQMMKSQFGDVDPHGLYSVLYTGSTSA